MSESTRERLVVFTSALVAICVVSIMARYALGLMGHPFHEPLRMAQLPTFIVLGGSLWANAWLKRSLHRKDS